MPSVIDVVIDATPSMQGFAENPEYRSLVAQSLANASLSGTTVEYHRLTTATAEGIEQIDSKMQVTRRSFYEQGNTELGRAVSLADSNRLVVLITDLFQTGGDMNRVAEGLKHSILRHNQAVGLFGVRFPFDGRVYDLGPDRRSFPFQGKRPLYGLVLGKPEAVSEYFDNLRRFVDTSGYHFFMVTSRVASESGRIRGVTSIENLAQVAPNVLPQLPENRYLGVSIRDNYQTAQFQASIKLDVLEDVSSLIKAGGIGVDISKVLKYDSGQGKYVQEFKGVESAATALTASVEADSGRYLRAEIRPQDLRRGSYVFNLVIGVDRWTLPKWVSEWNLPPSQFQSENPDGTKTANLKPFVLDVASYVTETHYPQLATLQVFVEKSR